MTSPCSFPCPSSSSCSALLTPNFTRRCLCQLWTKLVASHECGAHTHAHTHTPQTHTQSTPHRDRQWLNGTGNGSVFGQCLFQNILFVFAQSETKRRVLLLLLCCCCCAVVVGVAIASRFYCQAANMRTAFGRLKQLHWSREGRETGRVGQEELEQEAGKRNSQKGEQATGRQEEGSREHSTQGQHG